jgi:hypothetical protein
MFPRSQWCYRSGVDLRTGPRAHSRSTFVAATDRDGSTAASLPPARVIVSYTRSLRGDPRDIAP